MTPSAAHDALPPELGLLAGLRSTIATQASSFGSSIYTFFDDAFRRTASHMLRQGAVPRHVAFIMDGNRRYAKKMNVQTIEGHARGFQKLEEVCDYRTYSRMYC